jgi:methylmalonyl-CoA decarboxylase
MRIRQVEGARRVEGHGLKLAAAHRPFNLRAGECAHATPEYAMPSILVDVADAIGTITLAAPKHNALSAALVAEITEALAALAAQRVRVVVLCAKPGAPVWSSGHDVDELPTDGRDPLGWDDPLPQLIREIEEYRAPVIAMIEGTVWGGACEVAFACDLVIATPQTTFAVTPAKLGVPYNVSGMVTFVNAATLRIVKEMAFTAAPLPAMRALQLGLLNDVVAKEELAQCTMRLARQVAGNAPLSIAVMKEQLRILAGARPMSPQGFERVQGLRRIVYDSDDYREGIRAFKEKRPPVFRGK